MNFGEKMRSVKERLIEDQEICSVDDRGWYITIGGINGGKYYLYSNGNIYEGVLAEVIARAFWPTEKEAIEFFERWKNENT